MGAEGGVAALLELVIVVCPASTTIQEVSQQVSDEETSKSLQPEECRRDSQAWLMMCQLPRLSTHMKGSSIIQFGGTPAWEMSANLVCKHAVTSSSRTRS